MARAMRKPLLPTTVSWSCGKESVGVVSEQKQDAGWGKPDLQLRHHGGEEGAVPLARRYLMASTVRGNGGKVRGLSASRTALPIH